MPSFVCLRGAAAHLALTRPGLFELTDNNRFP
jgi:hypothetical protein